MSDTVENILIKPKSDKDFRKISDFIAKLGYDYKNFEINVSNSVVNQLPLSTLKNVEGKILTILEAIIPQVQDGGIQLEATKSLIRQEIGRLYSWATNKENLESGNLKK